MQNATQKAKTREKYLQSIEEPNYKLGILFLFPILEEREIPPPLPRQFSVEGETSNALTREFNQLDERTDQLGKPVNQPDEPVDPRCALDQLHEPVDLLDKPCGRPDP